MAKKFIILTIVLGALLLVVVALHVLSKFCPFTLLGLEEEQYEAIVMDTILLLAFGIALIPLIQALQNTRKLRQELKKAQEQFQKEHGIQSFPIEKEGEDDLTWMLPHYQKARRITIFAGSFDWLADKPKMEKRILELAGEGKLDLVSYKTKEQVEEALRTKQNLQDLLEMLGDHFKFNSKLEEVKCTIVQKSATDWEFLYRARAGPETTSVFNVCYIGTTPRNIELLNILSKFSKAIERQSVHAPD